MSVIIELNYTDKNKRMETEEIALEIIKLTIRNSENLNEILDANQIEDVNQRIKKIVERITPIQERMCIPPCSLSCPRPTQRITVYALQQVTEFRDIHFPENSSFNENIEWNQRIEEQITRFEQIYEKLSLVDFGVHQSEPEKSLINPTSDFPETISDR